MILTDISEMKPFSHKEILVKCDFEISDKCIHEWKCKLSEITIKRARNKTDKDACFQCYVILNHSGTKSHYSKYVKNDFYFSDINSEDKAYFLGLIASDGHVRRKRFTVKLIDDDSYILKTFSQTIGSNIPIHHKKYGGKIWGILDVSSMQMTKDLSSLLGIPFGPKDFIVKMPKLDDNLTWHFLRGLFDGDGHINKTTSKRKQPGIVISSVSKDMKKSIQKFLAKFNIPSCTGRKYICVNGRYAVKFIEHLYNDHNPELCLTRKLNECMKWKTYIPKTKKLNMKEAEEMRRLKRKGYKTMELAKLFNVGKTTVYSILSNKSYARK